MEMHTSFPVNVYEMENEKPFNSYAENFEIHVILCHTFTLISIF